MSFDPELNGLVPTVLQPDAQLQYLSDLSAARNPYLRLEDSVGHELAPKLLRLLDSQLKIGRLQFNKRLAFADPASKINVNIFNSPRNFQT